MARVTIGDCLEKINDRFMLVMLASELTREINAGSRISPVYNTEASNNASRGANFQNDKSTVVALRAIASGAVNCDSLKESLLLKYKRSNAKTIAEDLLSDPSQDEESRVPSLLDVDVDISNDYVDDDMQDEQDLGEELPFYDDELDDVVDDDASKPRKGNEAQILDDKSQMYTDEEDVSDD